MSQLTELKSLHSKVQDILEKNPHLRESDRKLVMFIWAAIGRNHPNLKFSFLYLNGYLPNHDVITRASRKIKEKNAHLRGENHGKRKEEEKKWRKEIYNL